MFRQKLAATLFMGIAAVAVPVFAQSEDFLPRQDVSVQALGSFVKTTTQNGIENKADKTAGVLGTYRYFFTKHMGVGQTTPTRRIRKALVRPRIRSG